MRIVLVTQSITDCRFLRSRLARVGYDNVNEFIDVEAALSHLFHYRAALLITSKHLQQSSGPRLAYSVQNRLEQPELPILLVAHHLTHEEALKSTENGVDGFLLHPFTLETMEEKIRAVTSPGPSGRYRMKKLV